MFVTIIENIGTPGSFYNLFIKWLVEKCCSIGQNVKVINN